MSKHHFTTASALRRTAGAALAVLALTATACADGDAGTTTGAQQPVSFTASIAGDGATRSPYDPQPTMLLESATDNINLSFPDGNASVATATARYAGLRRIATTPATIYRKSGESECAVYAYTPATVSHTSTSFTVKTDQSTPEDYVASDLLVAEASINSSACHLLFRHRMAKIQLRVWAAAGIQAVKSVRITGVKPQATLTPGQAVPTAAAGTATSIVMSSGGTGNMVSCCAVVPPMQTIAAGTPFIEVETNLGTVSYAFAAATTLRAGEVYGFKLEPSKQDLGRTVTLTGDPDTPDYEDYADRLAFHLADGTTFNMVRVEGGPYNFTTTSYVYSQNGTLQDYWIAETETTRGLWKAVTGTDHANQRTNDGMNAAVGSITWNEIMLGASGFCARLNAATKAQRPAGHVFTLPSLAEWIYAAKGGVHTQGYEYAGCQQADANEYMWHKGNASAKSYNVALKRPNELGLYDMSGNNWETVLDYNLSPGYALEAGGGSHRELADCRVTNLSQDTYNYATQTVGFRLCMKPVRVGDLYFSDGSWGSKAEYPTKTPIGIVFQAGTSEKDQALGYYGGYVMALCYAASGARTSGWSKSTVTGQDSNGLDRKGWGLNDNIYTGFKVSNSTASNFTALINDMDGLTHCRTAYATNGGKYDGLNAIYMAADFGSSSDKPQFAAPACSSGWYLPSAGQIYACLKNFSKSMSGWSTYFPDAWTNTSWGLAANHGWHHQCQTQTVYNAWNAYVTSLGLTNAGNSFTSYADGGVTTLTIGRYWWSSTEVSATHAYYVHMSNNATTGIALEDIGTYDGKINDDVAVRPVLAF